MRAIPEKNEKNCAPVACASNLHSRLAFKRESRENRFGILHAFPFTLSNYHLLSRESRIKDLRDFSVKTFT